MPDESTKSTKVLYDVLESNAHVASFVNCGGVCVHSRKYISVIYSVAYR